MKSLIKILTLTTFLAAEISAIGTYDQEWISKARLSLNMTTKIFGTLSFNQTGPDLSAELYSLLLAYDTYENFNALSGFGYAFQDQIGELQEYVYDFAFPIQGYLQQFETMGIDA